MGSQQSNDGGGEGSSSANTDGSTSSQPAATRDPNGGSNGRAAAGGAGSQTTDRRPLRVAVTRPPLKERAGRPIVQVPNSGYKILYVDPKENKGAVGPSGFIAFDASIHNNKNNDSREEKTAGHLFGKSFDTSKVMMNVGESPAATAAGRPGSSPQPQKQQTFFKPVGKVSSRYVFFEDTKATAKQAADHRRAAELLKKRESNKQQKQQPVERKRERENGEGEEGVDQDDDTDLRDPPTALQTAEGRSSSSGQDDGSGEQQPQQQQQQKQVAEEGEERTVEDQDAEGEVKEEDEEGKGGDDEDDEDSESLVNELSGSNNKYEQEAEELYDMAGVAHLKDSTTSSSSSSGSSSYSSLTLSHKKKSVGVLIRQGTKSQGSPSQEEEDGVAADDDEADNTSSSVGTTTTLREDVFSEEALEREAQDVQSHVLTAILRATAVPGPNRHTRQPADFKPCWQEEAENLAKVASGSVFNPADFYNADLPAWEEQSHSAILRDFGLSVSSSDEDKDEDKEKKPVDEDAQEDDELDGEHVEEEDGGLAAQKSLVVQLQEQDKALCEAFGGEAVSEGDAAVAGDDNADAPEPEQSVVEDNDRAPQPEFEADKTRSVVAIADVLADDHVENETEAAADDEDNDNAPQPAFEGDKTQSVVATADVLMGNDDAVQNDDAAQRSIAAETTSSLKPEPAEDEKEGEKEKVEDDEEVVRKAAEEEANQQAAARETLEKEEEIARLKTAAEEEHVFKKTEEDYVEEMAVRRRMEREHEEAAAVEIERRRAAEAEETARREQSEKEENERIQQAKEEEEQKLKEEERKKAKELLERKEVQNDEEAARHMVVEEEAAGREQMYADDQTTKTAVKDMEERQERATAAVAACEQEEVMVRNAKMADEATARKQAEEQETAARREATEKEKARKSAEDEAIALRKEVEAAEQRAVEQKAVADAAAAAERKAAEAKAAEIAAVEAEAAEAARQKQVAEEEEEAAMRALPKMTPEQLKARKNVLAKELNTFKTQFMQRYGGQKPTEEDYMADAEVGPKLKEFNLLNKMSAKAAPASAPPAQQIDHTQAVAAMSMDELQARKKVLARELNTYKTNFAAANGGKKPTEDDYKIDPTAGSHLDEFNAVCARIKTLQEEVDKPLSLEEVTARRKALSKELNEFKKVFAEKNGGRKPSEEEYNTDPAIAAKLKEFNRLTELMSTALPSGKPAATGTTESANMNSSHHGQPSSLLSTIPAKLGSVGGAGGKSPHLAPVGGDAYRQLQGQEKRQVKVMVQRMRLWKKDYRNRTGLPPSKADIIQDADISDTYMQLRKIIGDDDCELSDDGHGTTMTAQPTGAAAAVVDNAQDTLAQQKLQKMETDLAAASKVFEGSDADLRRRKNELATQLNEWKKTFAETQKRAPSTTDIAKNAIFDVYYEYRRLAGCTSSSGDGGGGSTTTAQEQNSSSRGPFQPVSKKEARKWKSRRKELGKELNTWKETFATQHDNRAPGIADIQADTAIAAVYDEYMWIPKDIPEKDGNDNDDDADASTTNPARFITPGLQDADQVASLKSLDGGADTADTDPTDPAEIKARKKVLAKELNEFKKEFADRNGGNKPTEADYNAEPLMGAKLAQFTRLSAL